MTTVASSSPTSRVSGNPLADAFDVFENLRRASAFWARQVPLTGVLMPVIRSGTAVSSFDRPSTFDVDDKPAQVVNLIPAPADDSGW